MLKIKPPLAVLSLCLALLGTSTGCNSFGNGQLVKQLQTENERLLSEYRAEKSRREQAEQRISSVELKLAESEKLLARQFQSGHSTRLSSRQSELPPPSTAGAGIADTGEAAGSGQFRWQRRILD